MTTPSPTYPVLRRLRLVALAVSPLLLAGCATLSADGGMQPVQAVAKQHLGQSVEAIKTDADQDRVSTRVSELLAQPLTADSAVQIALLNNRGLQASFQELGIAEAELVQASRLPNPGFSFAKLRQGDAREIDRTFSFDLAHLIALPLTRQLEARRFAATQRAVSMEMLSLAAETRKAYYAAVAAEQTSRYMRDVRETADAGAELAKRLALAGNWTKLQQAREHGFFAETTLNLARAEQARVGSRERLVRLLGLWGAQMQFTLPERLPDLPAEPKDQPDIENIAMAQRLDVQAAKLQAEATAKNLGLTKVTRFINVLEFGYQRNTFNDAPRQTGYAVSVEIPLFDWGAARVARSEALYMQSVHRAAQTAIDARSEVRQAYLGYRSAYDIARHYRDDIVPTAKRVSEENGLLYNGMFISVFELLADARASIAAVNAAIDAQRDFWMAKADLDMAMVGSPSLGGGGASAEIVGATAPAK
ncbi:TolC family protein [Roseateles puraquae]|jgi:outer membrane protein TolC|uniref:RND transporter n=1 Tax=Roseateles puraquae TaxID=431059 RepID=A0A254MZV5_9BURK|nr:TolC family protein [Roseateles puraquae]MDG0855813.1 TolC family protein [Roseateles puraquae]OWQ99937.1 RND transporter [Roseateles puraquae]